MGLLSDFGRNIDSWRCLGILIFPIQVEGTDEYKWVMLLSINPGA
jgi:levanase/fructan beta-fructosidase